jgi:hypothetical protein
MVNVWRIGLHGSNPLTYPVVRTWTCDMTEGGVMDRIDEQSKKRMTESLTKLAAFGRNPADKKAREEARMAVGDLSDVAGRFLSDKPQEDVAFSSSLSELGDFMDSLRLSSSGEDAQRRFDVALGDVEYRVKRLFGVTIR